MSYRPTLVADVGTNSLVVVTVDVPLLAGSLFGLAMEEASDEKLKLALLVEVTVGTKGLLLGEPNGRGFTTLRTLAALWYTNISC